ncbi:SGNH/GDSL hydrolase family protein, partial [Micromonospora sp. NBS 11-29]|uniref:SGNH/GDSL hydrolase family protein n=1 Tax=Micromonospora sp. NBS 11-29 TaxID=1960879 RepID=UPI001C38A4D7
MPDTLPPRAAPLFRTGPTGFLALVLCMVLVVAGYARPAVAGTDAGCASFGSSFTPQPIDGNGTGLRVGCARDAGSLRSLAASDSDLVATIDFKITERPDQFRQQMDQLVATTRTDMAQGRSLSQAMTLRAQRDSVGFAPIDDSVRFDGNLQVVGDSIVVVVPAGQIGTAGFWGPFWKKFVTGLVVFATAVVIGGLCLLAFNVGAAAAGPVCGAVAGGFSAGVGELVSTALDGKPIDKDAWGAAVGAGIAGLITGAFGGAAASYLSTGSRSLIASIQATLRRYALAFDLFQAPLNYLSSWLTPDMAQLVNEAFRRATRGVGVAQLRVMPLGDSITFGAASSDGSGYLARFQEWAARDSQVQLVGSQRSGPANLANEGHSGRLISDIAGLVDSALVTYQPNVVLLHIGTNDMNNNVDPGNAPARLGSLIDQIFRTAPGVALVVSTIVPAANAATQGRIATYNAAIRGVVSSRQQAGRHVTLVDTNAVTIANLADGLHPNDRGYGKMAISFYQGVLTAADAGWIRPPGSGNPGCGDSAGRWIDRGQVAAGVGAAGSQVVFADING